MKADNWEEFILFIFVHFFLTQFIKCHFLAKPPFTIFLTIIVIPLNLCLFLLKQSCLSKSVEESFCVLCAFFGVIIQTS